MGLTVQLVDEDGQVIEELFDVHGAVDEIVYSAPRDGRMVSFIDPYGDTVFNAVQAPVFIEEWDRLAPSPERETDRGVWQAVRDLAERCVREPHHYLKFLGD